jgi:hypothetical protein
MAFKGETKKFLDLVAKVHAGTTGRSENDLTSYLAKYLQSLGLHTVIDTGGLNRGRKRPDLRAYVDETSADLVLPAEIVIESKKPAELKHFSSIVDALLDDELWNEKTVPYIAANIERIQYFGVATFVSIAFVAISPALRRGFAELIRTSSPDRHSELKKEVRKQAVEFDLTQSLPSSNSRSTSAWEEWCKTHLPSTALTPPSFSEILNVLAVENAHHLEEFASRLADVVAGARDGELVDGGMFRAIRGSIPNEYDLLTAEVRRDLQLFLMMQHPGADLKAAESFAHSNLKQALDEFVASSVHSLIGRLFAFKSIEDGFCVGVDTPE